MASGLITSLQIDGETMETVTDFILEGSTHSSILAWKIPWTKESGSLLSMGLQRVGHDWATSLSKITADGDFSHEMKRCLLLGRKAMTNLDCVLKSRDITLPTKVYLDKAMVFPVIVYRCESDHKEGWAPKNWFRIMVLEKTLESPLDCKEIKSVNPKGNQHWIFIGRTDAEAEVPILWPPDVKNWLTGKDCDAGNDRGEWGDRGWDGWMVSLTQWSWV